MYKMIVVDDEVNIRNGLKSIINWADLGIDIVCEAENGLEALERIEQYQPSIVLTDIKMPGMSGLQLMQRLKNHYSNIKFVVLSGYDDYDDVRAAMRLGAQNYLLKPINTEELTVAMCEVIESIENAAQEHIKYQEFLQLLQKNTLVRIITGQISSKELREKCAILNISFQTSVLYVALIRLITPSMPSNSFSA